ncbi:MAG: ATP-binding protein [Bacteroidales bacterium]|nr:ATP-binding protein [Bacteroidales bacterium]
MIINFSIQNFGPIKDKQTLSFEADKSTHLEDAYIVNVGDTRLLKLALIYGANASGKTTILKALDFLRELVLYPEDKKTDRLDFEPFLFDANTPNEPSVLTIKFFVKGVKYSYKVEFVKSAIVSEELNLHNPRKANVFKRTTNMSHQFTEIVFGSTIKIDRSFEKTLVANTLWNNTVLGGFLKTNIDFKELQSVVDWFGTYLKPIVNTNTILEGYVTSKLKKGEIDKDTLLDILRKADFHISDIKLFEEEDLPDYVFEILRNEVEESKGKMEGVDIQNKRKKGSLKFEHTVNQSTYSLPFELESSGTRRFYGFAGLLTQLIDEPSIVLIDELESSLHPDLYEHFLISYLMNSKESQVIASTHYRDILNNKSIFRNDAIWFTDKSENCATELYSLADIDSSVVRDTSNVLNAYKSGKLGATPNTGDYYIDTE